MAYEDCIAQIKQAGGDVLSDEDIEAILEHLSSVMEARKAQGKAYDLQGEMLRAADDMAKDAIDAAKIEQRNKMLNIVARHNLRDLVKRADEAVNDPSLGLEAALVGVNAPFRGGRLSADAKSNAILAEYLGGMLADLKRENLFVALNSKANDLDIARELSELTKKDGRPGYTRNADAKKIAAVIHKYRKAAVARENRAGAWIRELEGYITRQSHDSVKMRRAGYDAWKESVLPKLDERTFDGVDDTEKFLKNVYHALVTGEHHKARGDNDLMFAFKGPGNLAKRLSEHRVLHFKDADSWHEYNRQFGMGSLMESIISDFERASRNTAMMETFGTNPRAMFETVLGDLKMEYRDDLPKYDKLKRPSMEWFYQTVSGETRAAANPSLAHKASAWRAIQGMAKLGGATLSAVTDLAFKAGELRYQGRNIGHAYLDSITSFMDGLPQNVSKTEVADLIGVGLEGQIGDVATRFNSDDGITGTISKMQRIFFKLNLLSPWTDANKRGVGLIMARDLAMQSGKEWGQIPQRTRDILLRYDIGESEWGIVRQAVRKADDGVEYLMPDAIRDLPDSLFGKQVKREKDALETALRSYYADRVDFAVPTPGARERAYLELGTQRGTVVGEAVRFMMQFKSFPVTILTKPLGRDLYSEGAGNLTEALIGGKGDLRGLAYMIVGSTILGYFAQSFKELAKGRNPRDPEDYMTWVAAMTQGGGFGLYGDFFLGETNRFGRSLLDSLAGPTFGTISDLDELRARLMAGDDLAAKALQVGVSNMPFANLFYTRLALDHMVLYGLQESINPGYLRRMERRIERENNQTFFLPPTSAIR